MIKRNKTCVNSSIWHFVRRHIWDSIIDSIKTDIWYSILRYFENSRYISVHMIIKETLNETIIETLNETIIEMNKRDND